MMQSGGIISVLFDIDDQFNFCLFIDPLFGLHHHSRISDNQLRLSKLIHIIWY